MEGFSRTILLTALAIVATGRRSSPKTCRPRLRRPPSALQPAPSRNSSTANPDKVIDAVGWVFGIPEKIILWDRRAANHSISPETEQSVAQYLSANGMESTKVRVNQYDPLGDGSASPPTSASRRLAVHARRFRHTRLYAASGPPLRFRWIQPVHR